jgi:hypothetical protein
VKENAVVEAVEAIGASVSTLAVLARRGTGRPVQVGSGGAGDQSDLLPGQADAYLEGLEEVATLEAQVAALKVQFAPGSPLRTPCWRRRLRARRIVLSGRCH